MLNKLYSILQFCSDWFRFGCLEESELVLEGFILDCIEFLPLSRMLGSKRTMQRLEEAA